MTLDRGSWGYSRTSKVNDYVSIEQLLNELARTISCGGNILLNVGPTKEGLIPINFQQILLQLGEWLKTNGEAIYDSIPYILQNDTINSNTWYTQSKDSKHVYAIILQWPESNQIELGLNQTWTKAEMFVGANSQTTPVYWKQINPQTQQLTLDPNQLRITKWAWTVRFTV